AVAAVVERAFQLIADLLEVMPVARRIENAAHLPKRELEVVDAARFAFHHDATVEHATAMFEAALERDLVGLNDLHGFLLCRGVRTRWPRQFVANRIASQSDVGQSLRRWNERILCEACSACAGQR